jgi:rod shape-determining protein MreC
VSYRDGPFNDLKVPLTWTAAVAVIVALVVGIALLLSDRRETLQTQAYGVGRRVFDVADKPVSGVLSEPSHWVRVVGGYFGDYLFAAQENHRLKQEVAELRQWRDVAMALQDTNRRYRAILGLKTDPPIPMVSGRVVLDSRGPFANTRLANIGSEAGVRVGNPVMSDRGLVGRVVGVASGASRVLLLTDIASRTPVLIARTDARAILLGDGGSNPRLAYLRGQDPVKEGDRILTSGDGGVFPRGLPVGTAAKGLDGQWRVRLDADSTAIDFIRVLEFQDFTALVDEKQLENSSMPPLPTGEKLTPPATQTAGQATATAGASQPSGAASVKAAGAATVKTANAKGKLSGKAKAKDHADKADGPSFKEKILEAIHRATGKDHDPAAKPAAKPAAQPSAKLTPKPVASHPAASSQAGEPPA